MSSPSTTATRRMVRAPDNLSLKRKRPTARRLTESESVLYNLIRSKQDMGMKKWDMGRETKLPNNVLTKSLKSLEDNDLVKQVVNFQNTETRHNIYMAVDFNASTKITGGAWYVKGKLDTEFIRDLKDICLTFVSKIKVATIEVITESIRKSGAIKVECTTQQIAKIMQILVLDNEIMEVRSTEKGEFASIPLGTVCYKCSGKGGQGVVSKTEAMVSIPCGVCPRISECSPSGIISPTTCVCFNKWLDF